MRGPRRTAVAGLALCALVVLGAALPASAAKPRKPVIQYAQYNVDQSNTANYRFEAKVKRGKSVAVKLRVSPAPGEVTGPVERLNMSKDNPDDREIWAVSTGRTRSEPCYRAVFVATNRVGLYKRSYRYCIFGHTTEPRVTFLRAG